MAAPDHRKDLLWLLRPAWPRSPPRSALRSSWAWPAPPSPSRTSTAATSPTRRTPRRSSTRTRATLTAWTAARTDRPTASRVSRCRGGRPRARHPTTQWKPAPPHRRRLRSRPRRPTKSRTPPQRPNPRPRRPRPRDHDDATTTTTTTTTPSSSTSPTTVEAPAVDRDCRDFATQADAQVALESTPGDLERLDADNDGIACEDSFGTEGSQVAVVPVGGVATGGTPKL